MDWDVEDWGQRLEREDIKLFVVQSVNHRAHGPLRLCPFSD